MISRELENEEWKKCCFRVDMGTGELVQRAYRESMRYAFGVCNIGHLLYLVGGTHMNANTARCEQYNILTNKWCTLDFLLPTLYHTYLDLKVLQKRYIFSFGGSEKLHPTH